MGSFESSMARFATLTDAELRRHWTWRVRELDVESALYRSLEEEMDAAARHVDAAAPPEAERILALAQCAFGELRGLLVGRDDALLDRSPGAGSWPLRSALTHLLAMEPRYRQQTLVAAHQKADTTGRFSPPAGIPPFAQPDDELGGVGDLLSALARERLETDGALGSLSDDALAKPARWIGVDVDVRFRLHRFASHFVEHTVQCERILDALGEPDTAARRIVRTISATRGAHEHGSPALILEGLDRRHAERVRSFVAEL